MSAFRPYSLNISCSSRPLIAEDIKVPSSQATATQMLHFYLSDTDLLGVHLELLPTDFHAFEGG